MTKTVEDCPFCGGNHLKLYGTSCWQQVYCMKCNARGPKLRTAEEALRFWNKAPRKEMEEYLA